MLNLDNADGPMLHIESMVNLDRINQLFPDCTPAQKYCRSIADYMLRKPEGIKDDNTPCSVNACTVNNKQRTEFQVYEQATGQAPDTLLQGDRLGDYIVKQAHKKNGNILAFAPGVLDYLLCHTGALPVTGRDI
jgi:hypothetical protein